MSSKSSSKSKGKASKSGRSPSKSKLIQQARKALSKTLKEHAELTAGSGVSLKKAQRAGAKLAAAAAAYAEAVQAKTGLENPFVPGNGKLDLDTIKSLQAERGAIEKIVTGAVPIVASEPGAAPASEAAPRTPARRTPPRTAGTTGAAPRATGARRTNSSIGTGGTTPAARRAAAPKPDAS